MPLDSRNIFQKIFAGLVKFFTSRAMKTFYWQTADAFLAIFVVSVSNADWIFVPLLASGLMILTKYVNKNYLMSKKAEETNE